MPEITLDFRVSENGSVSVINATTGALTQMESAATKAGGSGGGGLGGLVQGANDLKASFNIVSGSLNNAVGMIASVNAIGEASRKANIGLDIMSKGAGDSFLAAGRAATRGLVDDMGLAHAATDGLARGLFSTADEFKRIATDGAAMGTVLGTDAAGGVNSLEGALEKVGSKRAAMSLGLDADAIMTKFKELRKSGEDATTAWRDAVLGAADAMAMKLGPSIDNGPGAAMTRLSVKWENFKAAFSERVSVGLDGIAGLIELMDNPTFTAFVNGKTKQFEGIDPGSTGPSSNAGLGFNAGNGKNLNDVVSSGIAAGFETLATDPAALAAFLGNSKTINDTSEWGPKMPQVFMASNREHAHGNAGAIQAAQASERDSYLTDQSMLIDDGRQSSKRNAFNGSEFNTDAQYAAARALIQVRKEDAAALKDDIQLIQARTQAVQDATAKEIAHRAAIQSVDQAFGIQKDGLYGQVGATGAQGSAQARNDLITEDKRFGTARTNKDLAKFDAADKKGADDYALATGAATKESLAFRDAEAAAADGLAKHRIGLTEYWKEMKLLADAAKDGKTSLTDITSIGAGFGKSDLQPGSSGHGASKKASAQDLSHTGHDSFAGSGGAGDATDPATKLLTTVSTVITKTGEMQTTFSNASVNANINLGIIHSAFAPIHSALDISKKKALDFIGALKSAPAVITINMTAGQGNVGGGGSGTPPSRGGTQF